ncbi:glycerophosphodiester phosphodiesterase [Variovorax sp. LARHSF232]
MRHSLAMSALALVALAGVALPAAAFDLQAHRGGRGLAPENTLVAFEHAMALGVDTLELDIGLTADKVVVVAHDLVLNPDLARDAKGAWLADKGPALHTLTLAQLQGYDVGRIRPDSAYGKQFAQQRGQDGVRIPTLAQLFTKVTSQPAAGKLRFNIETKLDPTQPELSASPEDMVGALLAEVAASGMNGRVTIQSFDWRTLALVGRLMPAMPRAYLTSPRTLKDSRWTAGFEASQYSSTPQLVRAASAVAGTNAPVIWSPSFADLTQEQVKEAHSLGFAVMPWTVNRREDMAKLIDWKVDGLITDYPDVLRELMRERGMALPKPIRASSAS